MLCKAHARKKKHCGGSHQLGLDLLVLPVSNITYSLVVVPPLSRMHEQAAYIIVVIMLHIGFAGTFLLQWHRNDRFGILFACSWIVEAVRAAMLLPPNSALGPFVNEWYCVAELLAIPGTWLLFAACANLGNVKLPRWMPWVYMGVSIPLLLMGRYLLPGVLESNGWAEEQAQSMAIFVNQLVMFLPTTAFRVAIVFFMIRQYRRTGLPGAAIAAFFGIPYAVVAIVNPFQFYFGYYPDWIHQLWVLRVFGFSLGILVLLLSRQFHQLVEGEQRLNLALDAGRMATFIWDLRTDVTAWTSQQLWFPADDDGSEPSGSRDFVALIHPEDRPELEKLLKRSRENRVEFSSQFRLERSDDLIQWVEARGKFFYDHSGTPTRMLGVIADINDRKSAETELLRLENEVSRVARINTMSEFAGGISHELAQPITSISNFAHACLAKLQQEGRTEEEICSHLENICSLAQDTTEIVRGLRDFTSTNAQRMKLTPIGAHIRTTTELIGFELRESRVMLELELPEPDLVVALDQVQIRQILLNLIRNSVEAMMDCEPDQRNLTISAAATDDLLIIRVTDSGEGIAPNLMARIFEPFVSDKRDGTGIGLAISHRIAKAHNGILEASNNDGPGATFQLSLPRSSSVRS